MPSIHETAYPRLKSSFSEKELKEIFTPTPEEFDLAHSIAKSTPLKIVFLVLLKTRRWIADCSTKWSWSDPALRSNAVI